MTGEILTNAARGAASELGIRTLKRHIQIEERPGKFTFPTGINVNIFIFFRFKDISSKQKRDRQTIDPTTEEALEIADKIVKFYKENAKKGERMGRFIERMGFEEFQKAILG